jgi:hypothetical protein
MKLVLALLVLALAITVIVSVAVARQPRPSGFFTPAPEIASPLDKTAAPSSALPTSLTSAPAVTCHARGPLPDPSCTPGALNPRVTQATIGTTICVSGWTGTIRPPTSYTNALKVEQMRAYGLTGVPADYEEDHLLPLELGGDPRDPRNLWPQPRVSTDGAAAKDALENKLKRLVCAGALQLVDAQQCVIVDWVECDRRMAGR